MGRRFFPDRGDSEPGTQRRNRHLDCLATMPREKCGLAIFCFLLAIAAGCFGGRSAHPGAGSGRVLEAGEPPRGLRLVWTSAAPESARRERGSGDAALRVSQIPPVVEKDWSELDSPTREIERQVARTIDAWDEAGYPLGTVTFEDFAVDSLLTVRLSADPGPRVRVRGLRFSGAKTTRVSFLERRLGWCGPRAYRGSEWRRARAVLLGTGLFYEVEAPLMLLQAPGAGAADSADVEMLFRLREKPVNNLSCLLGYTDREAGLFGFVDLGLGNLMGTGRAARLFWQAQKGQEHRFEVFWHEPFIWRLPLELDLSLTHVLEDTLYAETTWGFDLLWAPAPELKVKFGWGWSRLVLGAEDSNSRRRHTARFGVLRGVPSALRGPMGWQTSIEIESTSDEELTLNRGNLRAQEWTAWGRVGLWAEQDAALVTGTDRLLRGDALIMGGARSIRGYFEGAYRAFRYLVQRTEIGPQPASRRGPRVYLLLDLGWLREWGQGPHRLYGVSVGNRFLWSAGAGVQVPSRAGGLCLDYAVPGGASMWNGRIHFGLESRF